MTHKTIIATIVIAASAAMTAPASALPASAYAKTSRLADGRWVKVKVSRSGVQKITFDQLASYGFTNPENVRVYGYSGVSLASGVFDTSAPDDMPQQYSEQIGDALYFYGEADHRARPEALNKVKAIRDYYSTVSFYYLREADGDELKPVTEPTAYRTSNRSHSTHVSLDYQEREEICPGEGGTLYYSAKINDDPQRNGTYIFKSPDLAGQMAIIWQGVARTLKSITIQPKIPSGLSKTGTENCQRISRYDSNYENEIIISDLPEPSYIYLRSDGSSDTHTFTFDAPADAQWAALNFVALAYERSNRLADNGELDMMYYSISQSENVTLSEASATTRVWDITEPLHVRPLETFASNADDNILKVSPGRSGQLAMVAFNPDSDELATPEFAGEAANTNLHAEEADADMVIVTNSLLLNEAERLAELHRIRQGLNVRVSLDTDIYNEFSSGAKSALGVRRYLKMLSDRNPGKLRYLLLFGKGVFDNRHILYEDKNYLPTFELTDDAKRHVIETKIYCSDNFFGMLDDSFTFANILTQKVSLAVGRIPVESASEAALNVDKVESYFDTYSRSDDFIRLHSMADRGDNNQHQDMGETTVRTATSNFPQLMAVRAFNDLYPDNNIDDMTQLTMNTIAGGVGLVTFAGHTSAQEIGTKELNVRNIPGMHFGNRPLMVLATCGAIFIDRLQQNVGVKLVQHSDGPIGIVGAGRSVYLRRNSHVLYGMTEQYYRLGASDCLGDAWTRAYNAIVDKGSDDATINTLCYNYIGDPAVPSGRPGLKATVEEVNGSNAEKVDAAPYTTLKLSGRITDADGKLVDDYNGDITVTVLERPEMLKTLAKTEKDTVQTIRYEQSVLAKGAGRAVKGNWDATVYLPEARVTGTEANRIIVAAHHNYSNRLAVGDWKGLNVTADISAKPQNDTTGPEIADFYVDSEDFANGDGVTPDISVTINVNPDPAGIRLASGTIGQQPTLTLDGSINYRNVSNAMRLNNDGSATLSYKITDLAIGNHTLTFEIYDNLGNKSERTISFVVVNNTVTGSLSADDYLITANHPAATFDLSVSGSGRAGRLLIINGSGETVYSTQAPVFPLTWTPAADLPDGSYRARVTLVNGASRGVTPDLKLMLKRK